MFTSHAAFVVVAALAAVSGSAASQEACQDINAWNCGSGAYVQVPRSLDDIVAIDAGDIFSVALRSTGQVVVWGDPPPDPVEVTGGHLSQPYLLPQEAQFRTVAIAAGQEHGTVLTSDGVLIDWHQDYAPRHNEYPGTHTDVAALAAGGSGPIQDAWNGQPHFPFLLILHEDGSIAIRGDNVAGENGDVDFDIQTPPADLGVVRAVAAGGSHALALTDDGRVVGWGSNDHGETAIPEDLDDAVVIAAGKDHSLAVRSDGTVMAWGLNTHGQCDVPSGLSNVVAVAGAMEHSVAVRSDGTVVAWGSNEFGQLDIPAGLGPVQKVACGRWHTLALGVDGTITAWGDDRYGQSSVNHPVNEAFTGIQSLAVGTEHRLAVNAIGDVMAWGGNDDGQCDVPASLGAAVAVAAGEVHSLALEATGTVIAWGGNDDGQCDVPAELHDVTLLATGHRHSLALRSDGTVVAWGMNDAGQCDVPPGLTDVIAIAAGQQHSLALKRNGIVEAWGSNDAGQIQLPDGLQHIRAIGAGGWHSLAVDMDGIVHAWGANGKKQTDVPDDLPPVVSVQAGTAYSIARTTDGRIMAWGDCGERRPGPPFLNRHYPATFPVDIDSHVRVAAGPIDVMSIRDTCPPCSPADFNRDDTVNQVDMLFLFTVLGESCIGDGSDACRADLNHDGAVALDDLSVLFLDWGACPSKKDAFRLIESNRRD
ncbi:hypothetical protein OAG62_00115 [bacterium]|nr:hypothetical protein [bacterium]